MIDGFKYVLSCIRFRPLGRFSCDARSRAGRKLFIGIVPPRSIEFAGFQTTSHLCQ